MEEHLNTNEYRTGETRPKKKRTGPIAALFICVIFLCGLISVLGVLNTLFAKKEAPAITFSKGAADESPVEETSIIPTAPLGFTCQSMAITYQYLHSLPSGLYINYVVPGSPAAALGISPGDVLIAFDDALVNHPNSLAQMVSLCPNNTAVKLQLFHTSLKAAVCLPVPCKE